MINGIFYAITTIALIIYFIKEKKIEKKRKEKSMKKIDDTLTKWNMFMGTERNAIVKFLDGTFSLILVILLVLFIQKFFLYLQTLIHIVRKNVILCYLFAIQTLQITDLMLFLGLFD